MKLKEKVLDWIGVDATIRRELDQLKELERITTKKITKHKIRYWILLILNMVVMPVLILTAISLAAPVSAWVAILFFGCLMIPIVMCVNPIIQHSEARWIIPFHVMSFFIFQFRKFMKYLLVCTFVGTFFLIIPHFIYNEHETVAHTLGVWLIYSIHLFFTLLFTTSLILLISGPIPYYILRRYRWAETPLATLTVIIYFTAVIHLTSLIFFFEAPELIDLILVWSPVSAPFYLPVRDGYYFLNDPKFTALVMIKTALIMFLALVISIISLRLEPIRLANRLWQADDKILKKKEKIRIFSQNVEKAGELKTMDMMYHARENVSRTEELFGFRFSKGPDALVSMEEYRKLQGETNGDRVATITILALIFVLLVAVGSYYPYLTLLGFGMILMILFTGDRIFLATRYTSDAPMSYLQVIRQTPISEADLHRLLDIRLKRIFDKNTTSCFLYILAVAVTSVILSWIFGIKVPFLRFFFICFVLVPFLSFCLSRLLLMFSTDNPFIGVACVSALFVQGIFNIFWIFCFLFNNMNWMGWGVFLLVNGGSLILATQARCDLFDIIYERISERFRKKEKYCVVGIIMLMAFSIYSMGILINTDVLYDDPYFYSYDDRTHTENLSNVNITFTHDVIIRDNITFENCSIHFKDSFFEDRVLFVKSDGFLTLRNCTLDASYNFHFWSAGELFMDNVTVSDLYGCSYTANYVGGMIVWGNTTIRNSTIKGSGAMGLFVSECSLTMENSSVLDSKGNGIRGVSSDITVRNCTFQGNSERDINLRKCNASVTNCTFDRMLADAIVHSESFLHREDNNYVDEYDDDDSWWRILAYLSVAFVGILMIPALLTRYQDKRDWQNLEMKYGLMRKLKEVME